MTGNSFSTSVAGGRCKTAQNPQKPKTIPDPARPRLLARFTLAICGDGKAAGPAVEAQTKKHPVNMMNTFAYEFCT